MKLMIVDEAHDEWIELDVTDAKKEGETLVVVSPPLTVIIGPFKEFSEKVVDLVDG